MTKFERDCLSFYEELGTEAKDAELKELYGLLADAQKRHLARLDEIMESRRRDELETSLLERAETLDYGFRRLLFDHDLIKAMKNDRDAFEHVVHAEEDVIRLFEGVARAEKSEGTRRMMAMLAEDEKEHLAEIEEIYDFIEKPHCYLEWGEFSNLKTL
ncbi:MAG TPA: ferritin family protein [Geobacteraceae bacterium]|nr:ferritin family protein [Geobacteraceae bacterium]